MNGLTTFTQAIDKATTTATQPRGTTEEFDSHVTRGHWWLL